MHQEHAHLVQINRPRCLKRVRHASHRGKNGRVDYQAKNIARRTGKRCVMGCNRTKAPGVGHDDPIDN